MLLRGGWGGCCLVKYVMRMNRCFSGHSLSPAPDLTRRDGTIADMIGGGCFPACGLPSILMLMVTSGIPCGVMGVTEEA